MAHIVLFHHALGLTPGVLAFGGRLEAGGHTLSIPDLYDGRVFDTLDDGVAHAQDIGFHTVIVRAREAIADLPEEIVYAGISLGVLGAQALAQSKPGARGALLLESFVSPSEFGPWPDGLRAQVHGMDADPVFAGEGDIELARAAAAEHATIELFTYPGDHHLFTDEGLPGYDAAATDLVVERALEFLARV